MYSYNIKIIDVQLTREHSKNNDGAGSKTHPLLAHSRCKGISFCAGSFVTCISIQEMT